MSIVKPDVRNPREFLMKIIAGEILTRRNEAGPLARLWLPRGPRKKTAERKDFQRERGVK